MVTSLKQSISAAGHTVDLVQPKMSDLSQVSGDYSLLILYAGDYIKTAQDALVYLRDYCIEHELKACLVGYKDDFEELKKIFPSETIWRTCERPFNVKDFVEKLNEDLLKMGTEDSAKKHILVVDDSGTMLRTIKGWLSMQYKVSIASSAAMAISLLATQKPDLILLDYEMPVCNGPQFLSMIRGEITTADIPVIFLTAKNDAESVKAVLSLKPEGYLLKTMSSEQVLENINQFFEKQKASMK